MEQIFKIDEQIFLPKEYKYQKELTKGLNIFNLEFKKNITPEPELIYYSQYDDIYIETKIIKINNIILNLLNNFDGRCYKNVIYMLFICNPIFQEFMKLYKDTNLYKIFYIKEYEYNKDEYIKWFEYNFINKYYENHDELGDVDIKFLYNFIYGIKAYFNRFYPEKIDFNEFIFNHMFNLTVLHKNKLINNIFYSFIIRNNTTIKDIINTSNIWINLPGILILCNKTIGLEETYKIKPNKHITIKSIDEKIYNYTLYGLTFYNNDINAEHIITVIKDLNNKKESYYIFDNDLYTIYPLELNINKNKNLDDEIFYDKQYKDKNQSLKGGYYDIKKDDYDDIKIYDQDKKINYIINYGVLNMNNIKKEDENNYLSFIYYTDFGENSINHYFTTYKSEIIMYIRDDFIPKFKKLNYNLKYQQHFKTNF